MKKILTLILFLTLTQTALKAQVGIGTTSPDAKAILDLSSTSKGLLIPRMSAVQRVAITSPTKGLLVFDNDSSYVMYYNGTAWKGLKAASPNQWAVSGSDIYNASSGNVGIGTGSSIGAKLDVKLNNGTGIRLLSGSSTGYTSFQLGRTGVDGTIGVAGVSGNFLANSGTGDIIMRTETTNNRLLFGNNGSANAALSIYNNNVGIGVTLPSTLFTVADKFLVNSSGNILKINNVTTSFPGSQGSSGQVLTNDGSGNLTWNTPLAYSAGTGISISGGIISSTWTTSGSHIYNSNSGNVGIGTGSAPGVKLDVLAPGAVGIRLLSGGGTTATSYQLGRTSADGSIGVAGNATEFLLNSSSGDIIFRTESTSNKLLFGNSGTANAVLSIYNNNIGIGVTSPSTLFTIVDKFQVNSTGNIVKINNITTSFPSSQGSSGQVLTNNGSGTLSWNTPTTYTAGTGITISGGAISANNNQWSTSGSDIYNSNSGNVGIGTGSPSIKLDVLATSGAAGMRVLSGTGTVQTGYQLGRTAADGTLGVSGTAGNYLINSSSGDIVLRTESTSNRLLFGNNPASNSALSIYNNNVGIGVTSPLVQFTIADKFQVNGSGNILKINNVATSFPSTQGSNGQVLTNDGTGNLTWNMPSSSWATSGSDIYNSNSGGVIVGGTTLTAGVKFQVEGMSDADAFSIDGTLILSTNGSGNLFLGKQAGSNTTGGSNTMIGYQAGKNNGTGSSNYFGGMQSGYFNTSGSYNQFIGYQAGLGNHTGNNNVALGTQAGFTNNNGSRNTFIGDSADALNSGLTNATAIGYNAKVSIDNAMVLGNGSANVGINTTSPAALFSVSDKFLVNTSGNIVKINNVAISFPSTQGSSGQMLSNDGSGNLSWANSPWGRSGTNVTLATSGDMVGIGKTPTASLDVLGMANADSFAIGGTTVLSTKGTLNLLIGKNTGADMTTGSRNIFIGELAGANNTTGTFNIFMGYSAGVQNTTGSTNQFIGYMSGRENTTGSNNLFSGLQAGMNNRTGNNNQFMGHFAGTNNFNGNNNLFVGYQAGYGCVRGYSNTMLGTNAGYNYEGSRNTFLGDSADATSAGLTNATAIGYNAKVSSNNAIVLGNGSANVGIGKSSPRHGLDVKNAVSIDSSLQFTNTTDTSSANEIYFSNNGQIRSSDNFHRIIFDRNSQIMEFREFGDIYFSSGSGNGVGYGRTKKMVVKSSGKVGIGTSSPAKPLHIYGSGDQEIAIESSDAGAHQWTLQSNGSAITTTFQIIDRTAVAPRLGIDNNGNVSIGSNATYDKLSIAGNISPTADNTYTCGVSARRWSAVYAANGTIQTSDRRLKDSITDLNYGLKTVMAFHPVSYYWKKNPEQGRKVGLIAQEVQKLVPEVVKTGDDSMKTLGMNYAELVPVVINAIQEQQKTIDSINADNAQLKDKMKEVSALKEQINKMQAILSGMNGATTQTTTATISK